MPQLATMLSAAPLPIALMSFRSAMPNHCERITGRVEARPNGLEMPHTLRDDNIWGCEGMNMYKEAGEMS